MPDPHVHDDDETEDILDDLMNELVDLALEELEAKGSFRPFGAVVTTAGEFELTPAEGQAPERSEAVIAALVAAHKLKAAAKQIDASGLCFDYRLDAFDGKPATDAICCRLETRLGEALMAYLPYVIHPKRQGDERIALGEMMATVQKPEIFPGPGGRR